MLEIDTNDSVENWAKQLSNLKKGDFIFLSSNEDTIIWFATNYIQHLIRSGGSEVAPLYGQSITDLESFIYQVNQCLPVGYRLKADVQALYDLLLNFQTEPLRRFIIWNDAQHLFHSNLPAFEDIFELLIVAAHCNRNGISTRKENGTKYLVDQTNMFFFYGKEITDVRYLLDKEYFIPSLDTYPDELYSKLNFNVIKLID